MLHQDQEHKSVDMNASFPRLKSRPVKGACASINIGPELVLKGLKLQVLLFEEGRTKALAWLVLCWEHTILMKLKTLEGLFSQTLTESWRDLLRSGSLHILTASISNVSLHPLHLVIFQAGDPLLCAQVDVREQLHSE